MATTTKGAIDIHALTARFARVHRQCLDGLFQQYCAVPEFRLHRPHPVHVPGAQKLKLERTSGMPPATVSASCLASVAASQISK